MDQNIKGGIYCIMHINSGRLYIGSSIDISNRWRLHRRNLNRNTHHSKYLQHCWSKYEEADFQFFIIEPIEDKSTLLSREQYYLDILHPVFNTCCIAGSVLGRKHSEESKRRMSAAYTEDRLAKWSEFQRTRERKRETYEKISKAQKGKIVTEETKQKIREARSKQLIVHSEETKRKLSEAHRGKSRKPLTEEHKTKLSIAHKGRIKSFEERERLYTQAVRSRMSSSHLGKPWSEARRAAYLKRKETQ